MEERATYSIRAIFAIEYGIGFFWLNNEEKGDWELVCRRCSDCYLLGS